MVGQAYWRIFYPVYLEKKMHRALTICEAASMLCRSVSQVRRYIASGELRTIKNYNSIAVSEESVQSLARKLNINLRKAQRGLSIAQFAAKIGASVDFVTARIKNGEIEARFICRQYHIPERELEKFLGW
jgi:hypothetical protein